MKKYIHIEISSDIGLNLSFFIIPYYLRFTKVNLNYTYFFMSPKEHHSRKYDLRTRSINKAVMQVTLRKNYNKWATTGETKGLAMNQIPLR